MKKIKELSFAELTLLEEGILQICYLNKALVSLEQAREIVSAKKELVGDKPMYVLYITADPLVVPSNEAIAFIRSKEWMNQTIANAYVLPTLPQKITFRSVPKNKNVPTRYFKTREEAIEWLLQKKNQSSTMDKTHHLKG